MKTFSFIHTADLHLDSPFKGISEVSDQISLELKEATFNAFNKIIDVCIEKKVDFILIAGDIYDGTDRSLRAQLRFRDGLSRLAEAKIKAYIVHGNHDSLDGWSANLNWPQNVHIFGGKAVEKTSFEKDGDKIAEIYGISFPKQEIRTNLALEFPEISKSKKSIFTIGLLHCNVGSNTGHEPYAPCALQDLISRNFDYWALGHIHNKTILNKQTPLVIYPGNPQGLNPGEDGKKGCFLINVDKNGDAITDFIETDYVRWFTEKLSIENLNTIDELISGIEKCIENIRKKMKGCLSICRIVLIDRGILHQIITRRGTLEDILQNLRENELTESRSVWIESIIDNTNPKIEKESLLKRKDFIGDLVRFFEEIPHNNNESEQLKKTIEPLFSSSSGRKLLESISDEYLLDLIEKAEKRCLDKLIEPDSNEN